VQRRGIWLTSKGSYNKIHDNTLFNNTVAQVLDEGTGNKIYENYGYLELGDTRINVGILQMYNGTDWLVIGNGTGGVAYDQSLNIADDVQFHDFNATNLYTLGSLLNVVATVNTNFEYAGQTAIIEAGDTITQGNFLYWDASGHLVRADADAAASMPAVCFALNSTTSGHNALVLMQGWVYNSAWTLAEGDEVFVSTAIGAVTTTAPSDSGDQVQVVGIALTEDLLWFNPDYTVLEIS